MSYPERKGGRRSQIAERTEIFIFVLLVAAYPLEELLLPGAAFGGAFLLAHAEAVAAGLVLDVSMLNTLRGEGGVEEDAVMIVDHRVVDTIDEEDGRAVGRHMTLEREGVAQVRVAPPFVAQQSATRTTVDTVFGHGDDGIDGCHEEGFYLTLETTHSHHQMAAGGEAHHADAGGVDSVLFGMVAQPAQGGMRVEEHIGLLTAATDGAVVERPRPPSGHTVAEDEGAETMTLEPAGHLLPLALIVEPAIAATGTDDHRGLGVGDGVALEGDLALGAVLAAGIEAYDRLSREGGDRHYGQQKIGDDVSHVCFLFYKLFLNS